MDNENNNLVLENVKKIKEVPTERCYMKARHVLAIMGFLGILNGALVRMNLSIAIVAMVNYTDTTASNSTNVSASENEDVTYSHPSNGVFNWNTIQQGLILGCFFYGNVATSLPGAVLAKKFGAKLVLGTSMFFCSFFTLLTPIVAKSSFTLFVILRICLGLAQGPFVPVMQGVWGYWAPPNERSFLSCVAMSGAGLGTCIVYPLGGFLAESFGWEAVFYCTGTLAFVWTCSWIFLMHNTPNEHPRISEQEKRYIIDSIGMEKKNDSIKTQIPWGKIFTSLPFIGMMIGHFAFIWNYLMLGLLLPTYMATILKFELSSSGIFSALPYLLQGLLIPTSGYMTDLVRKRGIISTGHIRKIDATLGFVIPGLFLVLVGYVGNNVATAVAFFCISITFQAFNVSGIEANPIDIAPRYAGVVFAISNTVANSSGFIAPALVGLFLINENSIEQWRLVFWMSAGINVVGLFFFVCLATGEEQPWAKGKQKTKKLLNA